MSYNNYSIIYYYIKFVYQVYKYRKHNIILIFTIKYLTYDKYLISNYIMNIFMIYNKKIECFILVPV